MTLFPVEDFRFLQSLGELAYANPFLPERIALERVALGEEFDARQPAVWARRSDLESHDRNVALLAARTREVVDRARSAMAKGSRAGEVELRLYEDGALYLLYDSFRPELQVELHASPMGEASRVECWPKFKTSFEHYFSIPDLHLPSDYDPAHIFAGFFQIRRAFHHIFDHIIGQSMPAARLRAAVWQSIFTHDLRRYRRTLYSRMNDIATLISGPSGTGKELVARAIGLSRYLPFDPKRQRFSDDFAESFCALNLSALAPALIESDLFGHAKGAFTGATSDRVGFLEQCKAHGTVFLDEIGELDGALQVKLLRVVQSRQFSRVGESQPRSFHGKIIAATNRDLAAEMHAGRFRDDLYYRLCSDLITTPALREHLADSPDDLHNLVLFVARRIAGEDADQLAAEVEAWIDTHLGPEYPWPGNIRELEQCVRNCLVRGEYHPSRPRPRSDRPAWIASAEAGLLSADELLQHYCHLVHEQVGSYERAAERLGLDRRTVKRRIMERNAAATGAERGDRDSSVTPS